VYPGITHDGSTLENALKDGTSAISRALAASGATATTASELERAATDPIFAASRKLNGALDAPLAFSLVLEDSFSVCYEGAHSRVWLASAVVGALVVIGFPFVFAWSTWKVERAPKATLGFLRAALARALSDSSLRSAAAAYPASSLLLSALLVGTSTLAARATTSQTFISMMSVGIAAPLSFAAFTLKISPYAGLSSWKNAATALLMVLPAIASVCSILLFASRGDVHAPEYVAFLPLIVAAPLPLGIVIAWFRGMSRELAIERVVGGAAPRVTIPIHADTEATWTLIRYKFYRSSTGELAWALPSGGRVTTEDTNPIHAVTEVTWTLIRYKFYRSSTGELAWVLPSGGRVTTEDTSAADVTDR
jgi:hypothetical protein